MRTAWESPWVNVMFPRESKKQETMIKRWDFNPKRQSFYLLIAGTVPKDWEGLTR